MYALGAGARIEKEYLTMFFVYVDKEPPPPLSDTSWSGSPGAKLHGTTTITGTQEKLSTSRFTSSHLESFDQDCWGQFQPSNRFKRFIIKAVTIAPYYRKPLQTKGLKSLKGPSRQKSCNFYSKEWHCCGKSCCGKRLSHGEKHLDG